MNDEKAFKLLTEHFEKYPHMQIQDLLKFLYQSAFGCEHMVSSLEQVTAFIRQEGKTVSPGEEPSIDPLDGSYSRVPLSYLNHGLSARTLGKLFFKSSQAGEKTNPEEKLQTVKMLIQKFTLAFSPEEFEQSFREWKAKGYPPMHHSDVFKEKYHPAYRVISNAYVPFLPLFAKLDQMLKTDSLFIAIEGGSASGKTTLGEWLNELYDCTVFHTDDFFLRPEQRTPKRYGEIGGNIDYERLLEEILIPLSKKQPISYERFDCSTMTMTPPITITPKKLVVMEGAYSMHPQLEPYYDFSIFLDVTPQLQKARIAKRNSPQTAVRFYNEWIPMEQLYFSKTQIKSRCNMVIPISE